MLVGSLTTVRLTLVSFMASDCSMGQPMALTGDNAKVNENTFHLRTKRRLHPSDDDVL
jgi:hypothetical protein